MVSKFIANDNTEVQVIIDDLRRVREHLAQVEKMEKDLIQKLYNQVNEHEIIVMVDEDGIEHELATWKYSKDSVRFDGKKFKEDHADLYKEYSKVQLGSRRLIIKE